MKKSMPKITALCLCVILAIGGIATTAFALKQTAAEAADEKEEAIGESASDAAAFKDETVYVLANADGSVKKIIVSDWIKNTLKSAELSDKTQLTDTENVKGNETYTLNGENMRVWDADGNDIYYSGSIEKELPVDLAVSYKLDGNPVSPDELAGKSGRVTIRFDYKNKQYETVEIDGKKVKIYVPFAMLTGLILNDDVFTNVEVANGKLINDGSRTAVIGIAFPGLAENLAIAEDKLQIPDYVEISADANNFKLDMTVTLAANGIFNELDTKGLDSVSELTGSLDELTDAMRQLLDGSSELYGGLAELLDKSGELVKGIDELAAGAKALKSGAESLDAGAGELSDGAGKLTEGLNTLASNNDTLNGGAKQVFETLLSTANTQLAAAGIDIPTLTVENYAQVLNGVISSLDETAVYEQALEKVTAAVEAQRYTVTSEVTAAVKESVTAEVTAAVEAQVAAQVTEAVRNTVAEQVINAALHMDKSAYDAAVSAGRIDKTTQDAIEAAIDGQMQSEQVIAQIKAQTAAQMATEAVKNTVNAKVNEQMQSDAVKRLITEQTELQIKKIISEQMTSDEVKAQLAAAAQGAKEVIALKTSLDSYNVFYLGLQSYTEGVSDAAAGAGTLKSGTDELKAGTGELAVGASKLYDGILTLKNGTPTLISGITQLRDGSMQLSDGLNELNERGIKKLTEAVKGDLNGLLTRLRATCDVSRSYKNFAGAVDGADGRVKFIYRTDSIG